MKRFPFTSRTGLVLTLASGLSLTPLPAVERVNWGGLNYVGGTGQNLANIINPPNDNENRDVLPINDEVGDFDGDGNADDVRDAIAYSTTEPLNPTSAYGGLSNVFYGGFQVVRYNATTVQPELFLKVLNNTAGDRIRLGVNSDGAGNFDLVSGFLLWAKDDFLNAGTVAFDSNSGLVLDRVALANVRVRLLVRNGSTYYVSNTVATGGTGVFSLSRTALAAETWAVFTTPSSLRFTGTTFATVSFNDITGVGFYLESWRSVAQTHVLPSGQNFNLTLDEFVVGAN